jgi:hypothetical protein
MTPRSKSAKGQKAAPSRRPPKARPAAPQFSTEALGALAAVALGTYEPPGRVSLPTTRGPVQEPSPNGVEGFDFALFGTERYHLRCSSLPMLAKCPLRRVLEFVLAEPDAGGGPAQTGSLVHAAVAAYHNEPEDRNKIEAAMAALSANAALFPLADRDDARIFTQHYAADPRNRHAVVVAVEREVSFTLPPHPLDPTGELIWFRGTLDQIRVENGRKKVWDLKTGRPEGIAMQGDHALQVAAYTHGARCLEEFSDAEPGGIIRAMAYRKQGACLPSPDGVFLHSPFVLRDVPYLLDTVRLIVALIRSGEVWAGPGHHCSYCPVGHLDRCLPLARDRLGWRTE